MSPEQLLAVPVHRAASLREIAERLLAAHHVVLTTHLNADGDGAGSEAAVAAWLEARGIRVSIVNPTPFPEQYRFVLHRPGAVAEWEGGAGRNDLRDADLCLVLDTSEPKRIGALANHVDPDRTVVIDHHPPGSVTVGGSGVQDPTAAAAGELVYDLISVGGHDGPWPRAAVRGIYIALVTDTGSFRFQNTSPRVHAITADLLERGIDPEAMYRRLFGAVPLRRLRLLRDVLGTLETEPNVPLSWLVVTDRMIRQHAARSEDMDNLVEHARSVEGTEVAILFRGTADGTTKISFRSNGDVDVNAIARQFGGGGHVRASGALVEAPPEKVVPQVLAAAREALRKG